MTVFKGFRFSPRPNLAHQIRWQEWGEAAFAAARAADKPILLGISAVWCHWCHVMDETSYSDEDVIRLVNERFVAIRVDNDERPDVNRRYNMGGWPTTAFLLPTGEPIHGGTYIPPEQLLHLLHEVADAWRDRRADLVRHVADAHARETARAAAAPGALSPEIVAGLRAVIRAQHDPLHGGFGREPKFPQPRVLRFLLDEHRRHREADVARMLHTTLAAMAVGGMYDHVEGGFFRYATDREWRVPHFEKMLEDNAELLAVYAAAHRQLPAAGNGNVARDVVRYLDGVLWTTRASAVSFAGSQDADEEYFALPAAARARHGAPYVDRTLYTSWNALAVSGYLAAARSLGDPSLRERAAAVLGTILTRMRDADGALSHYDRGDGPSLTDLLGDLAAVLAALLDAYEDDAFPGALDEALRLATRIDERLAASEGGWWDAPPREDAPGRLALRERPIDEGAATADAFLRLAVLSDDERWRERALVGLRAFAPDHTRWGLHAAAYASAVARALAAPVSLTVVGPRGDAAADALWAAALAQDGISRRRLDPVADAARLAALGYPTARPAAFLCVGTRCSAPLGSPDEVAEAIARESVR